MDFLTNFMSVDERDGVDNLGLAEFRYNAGTHLATKTLSLKITYGVDPRELINLALKGHIEH